MIAAGLSTRTINERLRTLTQNDIDIRYQAFRLLSQFEVLR